MKRSFRSAILAAFLCLAAVASAALPRSQQGSVVFGGTLSLDGDFLTSDVVTGFYDVRVISTAGQRYDSLTPGMEMAMGSPPWNIHLDLIPNNNFWWEAGDHGFYASRWDSYYRNYSLITITAFQGFGVRTDMWVLNSPSDGRFPFIGKTMVPDAASTAGLLGGAILMGCFARRRCL